MWRIFGPSLCAAAVLCVVSGCGGPGVSLVPVQGTVTLDGEPLRNKSLMFMNAAQEGTNAGGNTNDEGRYELMAQIPGAVKDFKGVPPGRYKVLVFEPLIPIESEVEDEMYEPVFIPGEPAKGGIPPAYQSFQTTPLEVEVPEGGGELNLELTSRG
jgi:hypothetical protein